MYRLNKARVGLKHQGIRPSSLDVESLRGATASFFAENCPLVFGVGLDEVSLVEFVHPESARQHLHEAQAYIASDDILAALDEAALSYFEMTYEYEDRMRERSGRSPFYFGRELGQLRSWRMGLGPSISRSKQEETLAKFVDQVGDSLEAMQGAVKVLALGMDYRKYARFRRLTPKVRRSYTGKVETFPQPPTERGPSAEDAQFCVDFVIESALALADFDYSVEER